ncbi:MAG: tRNA (adenosine(37)-N6)-threonylcarbamoyltransferase complex transferase subunit TsaD [Candidatus Omnitrophota bacterium]|nr:tRNA (adenosine(37)-N6)-threonylcarbamoyltransferase complex transferase subunit TsaD [Candidatus Omnitrophota bacterium]
MLTLGIETSCDETACAVLDGSDKIRSNVISSSLFRHRPFGGVVPEIASRHCLEQIDFVFQEALSQGRIKPGDLDLVAVTQGPGLIGSLLVGIVFAKTFSYQMGIPLVGVNHLEAHLVANFIGSRKPSRFIGLLVSGGHTGLYLCEKGGCALLGETVDDAVGEAYDKTAKMMGLGYPGGPIMDRLAAEGNSKKYSFTKPKQKNRFAFSFSGIKTAVLYRIRDRKRVTQAFRRDMAASFQRAVVSWLVDKALDAARAKQAKHIVVGGGVSANSELRRVLNSEAAKHGIRVWFPTFELTMDNAAMIARRGVDLYKQGKRDTLTLTGDPNFKVT